MRTKKGKISIHKRKAMRKRNAKMRDQFFGYVKWKQDQDSYFRRVGGF